MAPRRRYAKPKDGIYFRPATPQEHDALQKARAMMLEGWELNDDNMQAAAYMTMRKILDSREVKRELRNYHNLKFWQYRKKGNGERR